MILLTKEEINNEKAKLVRAFKDSLFVYPTDTIYGIGCNATERRLVHKLRTCKEQYDRPLSIIAPSKDWIHENCVVNETSEEYLEKLPGPYTLILPLKNKESVARNVHLGLNTIGVRIPRHWFTEVISNMLVPVITTSANATGKNFMTNIENLNKKIKEAADYVIYDGELEGKPSQIIDLTKEPKIVRD